MLLLISVLLRLLPAAVSLSGPCPAGPADTFLVPFEVPSGTRELQVRRVPPPEPSILDFGLLGPNFTFRGWSGGNLEPAVVGELASSRSYVINGALEAGQWHVVLGRAQLAPLWACRYEVEVELRSAPTLPPQPQRRPYTPAAPLSVEARWFAGDFHIHSRESGDASPAASLDEIATFAASRGLDFAHISDHNTVSAASFMVDAQTRHPRVLLLPGCEWTTYSGHAGALFTTRWVSHLSPVNVSAAATAVRAEGGLFSINHEDMFKPGGVQGSACIGCVWEYGSDVRLADAFEVGIQGWDGVGWWFSPPAIEKLDTLHKLGYRHIAPVGGSDDHHGGNDSWPASPVGSPTTMVFAANLSHAALREGVRLGRTGVKLFGPSDPWVELTARLAGSATVVHVGGSAPACAVAALVFNVTSGASSGAVLCALCDNQVVQRWELAPSGGVFKVATPRVGRWRAEIRDSPKATTPRTLTNHLFLD